MSFVNVSKAKNVIGRKSDKTSNIVTCSNCWKQLFSRKHFTKHQVLEHVLNPESFVKLVNL